MDTLTIPLGPAEMPAEVQAREPRQIVCPSCGEAGESPANTVKCASCNYRGPVAAFSGQVSARKYGAPRAYTSRGQVD